VTDPRFTAQAWNRSKCAKQLSVVVKVPKLTLNHCITYTYRPVWLRFFNIFAKIMLIIISSPEMDWLESSHVTGNECLIHSPTGDYWHSKQF